VADPDDISQLFIEGAPDTGPDEISQDFLEAMATSGPDEISQLTAQAFQTTGPDEISQLIAQAFQRTGPDEISQLTIELLRGPVIIPPEDNPAPIFIFGKGGLAVNWFLVPQLSDSGVELRDKTIKSFRATGKMTNPQFQIYSYGPEEGIDVAAIEAGTDSTTGAILLTDTTQVTQTPRHQINVVNAMTHTVRLAGIWPGTGEPDRVDEIVYEVSQQGVRR
jgi:hypothetical protein